MQAQPLSKITVGNICQECSLSRKSFYYHFIDKYDLMNWIFDTEFVNFQPFDNDDNGMLRLCTYLYNNRIFYRQALKTQGPNSYREHFRALCYPVFRNRLHALMNISENDSFYIHFFTDALITSLERWILQEVPAEPIEYVNQLKKCLLILASAAQQMPL